MTAWDFERNWLRCEGRAIAFAESLTHAAVYAMAGGIFSSGAEQVLARHRIENLRLIPRLPVGRAH